MRGFQNRRDAGRQLAQRLDTYVGNSDVVVLGLPRGGIPVAFEVATRLGAPLDVLIVRKLGVPGRPELAMGAIASGGIRVLDDDVIHWYAVSHQALQSVEREERAEPVRREELFRAGRPPLDVSGKIVIVVDDGLATGASMAAALEALRKRHPKRLIAAVPIAPPQACEHLGRIADEIICLATPARMYAVGAWYEDFTQTTDAEVRELLDAATRELPRGGERAQPDAARAVR